MVKFFLLLFCLFISVISFGQINYEPQVLILAPNSVKYDPVFETEVAARNKQLKEEFKMDEIRYAATDISNAYGNMQIMQKSVIDFSKNIDFFKQTSLISQSNLIYHFFERFPNLLIKVKDVKCKNDLNDLKKISDLEKIQYVVNISAIDLYKQNGIAYAKITVQLYDNTLNSIKIDKTYIGDSHNPGFEFSCSDKTISCTINNAISEALREVSGVIELNNPTLKKDFQLQTERLEVLVRDYFNKPFNREILKTIIPASDTNINLELAYQTLYNIDKTKFVAFFYQQIPPQDLKTMYNNKRDPHVNVQINKDASDSSFFDAEPNNYAYVVRGVFYKGKWYYEKYSVTYFDGDDPEEGKLRFFNNLQTWGLFKENSTFPNADFWETTLFKKIPDLTKDPEWEKHGQSIWAREEKENRPYIGMYEIIANKLKANK